MGKYTTPNTCTRENSFIFDASFENSNSLKKKMYAFSLKNRLNIRKTKILQAVAVGQSLHESCAAPRKKELGRPSYK